VNQVQIEDVKVGTGRIAGRGSQIIVHYIGSLPNGNIFDDSTSRAPFSFTLGAGLVIEGWDIGLEGMRAGGVRKLIIPPAQAYGDKGAGDVIPPNSTLIFNVVLLQVDGKVPEETQLDPNSRNVAPSSRGPTLRETLSDTPFQW
jgi:peptidylprolyl isomerase